MQFIIIIIFYIINNFIYTIIYNNQEYKMKFISSIAKLIGEKNSTGAKSTNLKNENQKKLTAI